MNPPSVDSEPSTEPRQPACPPRGNGAVPYFVIAAVLLLTYASSVFTSFCFSDDYRFLAETVRGRSEGFTRLLVSIGRPITAYLIESVFWQAQDVAGLRWVRLIGIIGIVLLGWGLYRAMIAAGQSVVSSTLVAIVVCLMPAFQVYACWAQYFPIPYAALAAGAAARLACSAHRAQTIDGTYCRLAGAALLVCLAACVYQPAAMFFWAFMAIALLNPRTASNGVVRYLACSFGAAGAGLAAAFGVLKTGQAICDASGPGSRSALLSDVSAKVEWFVRQPITNSLNFVNLPPSSRVALIAGGLILGGVLIYFLLDRHQFIWRFAQFVVFIPLSYLPNLMVNENWASYRTQGALVSLLTIYAFMALSGCGKLILPRVPAVFSRAATCLSGIAMLAIALTASYYVNTCFVSPQIQELNLLRNQIRTQDPARAKAVYFFRTHWSGGIAPLVLYDEFGLPSSCQRWVSETSTYLVLCEMNPAWAELPVIDVPWEESVDVPAGSLIIDMRLLREYR